MGTVLDKPNLVRVDRGRHLNRRGQEILEIEEQGVNLQLSAKIVHSLRALEEKKLSVRFVPGNDRLHAKIYVGDRAATLGSSNFTQPGLRRQFEANARFAEDAEPGRFKDLATVPRILEDRRTWTTSSQHC